MKDVQRNHEKTVDDLLKERDRMRDIGEKGGSRLSGPRNLGRGSERCQMRKWSSVLPHGTGCNSFPKIFSAFGVLVFFFTCDAVLSLPLSREARIVWATDTCSP